MSISTSSMIADLNAQIAKADSSSTIGHLLHLATEVERLSDGVAEYDSSELISSTAEVGAVRYQSDGTMRVYTGQAWDDVTNSTYEPWGFRGTVYGYVSAPSNNADRIEKFSLTADQNSTEVGNLTRELSNANDVGTTSGTHLYEAGGYTPNAYSPRFTSVINKWPGSSDGNATDAGDLTVGRSWGSQSSSESHGYYAGGNTPILSNVIDKYSHSADANATDVGDLSTARDRTASFTNDTDGFGYVIGGRPPPSGTNQVIKYSHTSDGNSTGTATIHHSHETGAGSCSATNGYLMGGWTIPTATLYDDIAKYVFATDGNAGSVGDLTSGRYDHAGVSSSTHGYALGGGDPSAYVNKIEKFPFASEGNASDVADLLAVSSRHSGTQT